MHWLPLVAMVITSALPFPHTPVSRVAVATLEASSRPFSLVAPPVNHSAPGNVLQENAAHVQGSAGGRSSGPGSQPSQSHSEVLPQGRTLRTEGLSRSDPDSRRQRPTLVDFPHPDLLDSAAQTKPGPGPGLEPTDERRTAATSGIAERSSPPGMGAPLSPDLEEENLDQEAGPVLDSLLDRDEMFLDAHPRVLFSTSPSPPQHPPLLLLLEAGLLEEEQEGPFEGHGDRAPDRASSQVPAGPLPPARRDKRSLSMDRRRGEKSVCESESVWVTNKSTAVDAHGHNVTIMREIQTQTGPLKQFFYETRCRRAELRSTNSRSRSPAGTGVAGAGCLGVDKKQWVSECKAKQSFVRALTKDENNRVGWRWIRIDSSCVCVLLSRANQVEGREVHARTGRG